MLPHWFLALPFAILPCRFLIRKLRIHRRARSGRCLACGYDLRASKDRCPECGAAR
jgi:primosomal protein N'